jgi:hypothetical protein
VDPSQGLPQGILGLPWSAFSREAVAQLFPGARRLYVVVGVIVDHPAKDCAPGLPATLKTWRLLRRVRCCPQRGTKLIAAVLALETAGRS